MTNANSLSKYKFFYLKIKHLSQKLKKKHKNKNKIFFKQIQHLDQKNTNLK